MAYDGWSTICSPIPRQVLAAGPGGFEFVRILTVVAVAFGFVIEPRRTQLGDVQHFLTAIHEGCAPPPIAAKGGGKTIIA
jgi:hypothetical protein